MLEKIIKVGSGPGRKEYRIWAKLDGDYQDWWVEVRRKEYPTEYGNYVEYKVEITPWTEKGYCVHIGYLRQDWYGTGYYDVLDVCYKLHDENINYLFDEEVLEEINSEEDVKEYLRLVLGDLKKVIKLFMGNALRESY